MTYEPKEGDVIERGRQRIVNRWSDGHMMHCTRYMRGMFTGYWREDRQLQVWTNELAAMVNHMGWRVCEVLDRERPKPPNPPAKQIDPTPKSAPPAH